MADKNHTIRSFISIWGFLILFNVKDNWYFFLCAFLALLWYLHGTYLDESEPD